MRHIVAKMLSEPYWFWSYLSYHQPGLFGKLFVCQFYLVFWRTKMQGFFHGHTKQLWVPVLGGPIWHHNYCFNSVPGSLCKCWIYNNKSQGHAKVTVAPFSVVELTWPSFAIESVLVCISGVIAFLNMGDDSTFVGF